VAVSALLAESFDPAVLWCSSRSAPPGCNEPGFAVVFGGTASVRSNLIGDLSLILGGRAETATEAAQIVPDSIFFTGLNMAPLFHQELGNTPKICGLRGAFVGARWILVASNSELQGQDLKKLDMASDFWFRSDVDQVTRSPGISSPGCIEIDPTWSDTVFTASAGLDGRRSSSRRLNLSSSARYEFETLLQVTNPQLEGGVASHIDSASGETRLTFSQPSGAGITARFGNKTSSIDSASITVTIRRGGAAGGSSSLFEGSWNIVSGYGTAIGQIKGEAILAGGVWQLRGKSTVTGGSWPEFTGFGGFSGTLNVNSQSPADDILTWRIDGTLE
jgi:hypothetical protein